MRARIEGDDTLQELHARLTAARRLMNDAELQRKQIHLLRAYAQDLADVRATFSDQKACSAPGKYLERQGPPLYMNMPPTAGALYWARGLLLRIEDPMVKLQAMMKDGTLPSEPTNEDGSPISEEEREEMRRQLRECGLRYARDLDIARYSRPSGSSSWPSS